MNFYLLIIKSTGVYMKNNDLGNLDINTVLIKHYEKCYQEFGVNPKASEWSDPNHLQLRYLTMMKIIKDANIPVSILDVGCGFGFLLDFLIEKGFNIKNYVGIDVAPSVLDAAKKRHPGFNFINSDINDPDLELPCFDYVLTNGMFNLKLNINSDYMSNFFYKTINNMFRFCNVGIAFNVMSTHVNFKNDNLFYQDPVSVLSYCLKEMSRFTCLHHDYPLYEYFTFVYKPLDMLQK
ncbi:MAG: class I SAM-dependent methyltransferase [Stygiobacter sp.]|nr:MAG: class I SAM-dependent methyltransferase [Stygiobacter sp.]